MDSSMANNTSRIELVKHSFIDNPLTHNVSSVSLTVLDTYAMGQILFDQKNYMAAASWIYQSVVLMEAFSMAAPLEIPKNEVRMVYAETLLKLSK